MPAVSTWVVSRLSLTLGLLMLSAGSMAMPGVTVEADFDHLNLATITEYHVDASSQLNRERVKLLPDDAWIDSEMSNLTFGFSSATYWFRFELTNRSKRHRELLLQMAYARFDSVEVHLGSSEGASMLRSGKDHAFRDRPIAHRHHLFPIDLRDGQSVTVYIRARTTGAFNFPLSLWDKDEFYREDQGLLMLHGAYFGIWLLAIIFNVVLYSAVNHRALASFLGLTFSFGVYQLATLGLGTATIWGSYPDLHDATIVTGIGLSILSLGWLCSHLLELDTRNPVGFRVMQVLTYPALLGVVAYPVFGFAGVMPFLTFLTIPASAAAIVLGVRSILQGNRLGRYASIAWTALLLGVMARALNRFELIPNNFATEQALPAGFIIMIVTLSFSIAAEYRRQTKQEQRALLQEHSDQSADQQQANQELEVIVGQRTEELNDMLQDLQQANDKLREINTMDAVTGIKNRHYFDTVFDTEWRRASREQYPISILLLDIDHFKLVNDRYGHLAGDECLHEVAATISTTVKRPADILARYGGEEFVAVLPYVENDKAMSFADQIRARIEARTYVADGHEINITVSIGVCTVTPGEKDERKDIISAADIALYEAKGAGRNQVCNAGQLTVHTSNTAS